MRVFSVVFMMPGSRDNLAGIYPVLKCGGAHLYLQSGVMEKARLGYIQELPAASGYITKCCVKKKRERGAGTLVNSSVLPNMAAFARKYIIGTTS